MKRWIPPIAAVALIAGAGYKLGYRSAIRLAHKALLLVEAGQATINPDGSVSLVEPEEDLNAWMRGQIENAEMQ